MEKKEPEIENEQSKYDLIEYYMFDAIISSNDEFTMLLRNCINGLVDDLCISEKEAVAAICRALRDKRVQLKHKDLEVENIYDLGTEDEKIARYVNVLEALASNSEYDELLTDSYISFVQGTEKLFYSNSCFVKNMLYLLEEEKNIRKSLSEKLLELEKQIENLYARFLELTGILIAIFSIIGFNLLNIGENTSVKELIVVNCTMIFSLSALSLLIELLFMRREASKRVWAAVSLIGVLAFLGAIILVI